MEKEKSRDRKEGEKKFRRLRAPRAHTRTAAYKWGVFPTGTEDRMSDIS